MKLIAVALMAAALAACGIPPEMIRPQYAGSDAAVVKIYCADEWVREFYVEIDGELAGVLTTPGVTTIRTAPGTKSVITRNLDARVGALPVKIEFKPGRIYLLHVEKHFMGLITTKPVDEKTFLEMAAKNRPSSSNR